jgi:hypothetical protein
MRLSLLERVYLNVTASSDQHLNLREILCLRKQHPKLNNSASYSSIVVSFRSKYMRSSSKQRSKSGRVSTTVKAEGPGREVCTVSQVVKSRTPLTSQHLFSRMMSLVALSTPILKKISGRR